MFKKSYLSISVVISLFFLSCEIVQETKFEEDGSGRFSLGFDMSDMMGSTGMKSSGEKTKQIDTIIDFAKVFEEKKDSIKGLSKEEQEKLKGLEDLKFAIKMDTVSNKYSMRIDYDFDDVKDLKTVSDKIKQSKLKELENVNTLGSKSKKGDIPNLNDIMDLKFSSKRFSAKITKEGLKQAEKNRDTTLTKDNPFANMIKFKVRYLFPYKIKEVNNKNARVMSDFKGLEFDANLFEVNENPNFFDLDVKFE